MAKKKSLALRLPKYDSGSKGPTFFSFSDDFKNYPELIKAAKSFGFGSDGVGGYNYKKNEKVALGYIDLTKKYSSAIDKSFRVNRYIPFEKLMK